MAHITETSRVKAWELHGRQECHQESLFPSLNLTFSIFGFLLRPFSIALHLHSYPPAKWGCQEG